MTNQANEFVKTFENMFTAVPGDFNELFKNAAEYNSKFYKIGLDAARENVELGQAWATATLKKAEKLAVVKGAPADYAKVTAEFVNEQVQASPEQLAAFGEVAKKAQTQSVELMLAAGKELQAEATKTAKKATK
jgi:hypothetical protein